MTQPAQFALGGLLVFYLLVMLSGHRVAYLLVGDLIVAALVLLGSCIALLNCKAKGLPVFTEEVAIESGSESEARVAREEDPVAAMLRNPPADAQVTNHPDRRVVVLADGSVMGELLTGRAQRFPSLDDFRAFVGS